MLRLRASDASLAGRVGSLRGRIGPFCKTSSVHRSEARQCESGARELRRAASTAPSLRHACFLSPRRPSLVTQHLSLPFPLLHAHTPPPPHSHASDEHSCRTAILVATQAPMETQNVHAGAGRQRRAPTRSWPWSVELAHVAETADSGGHHLQTPPAQPKAFNVTAGDMRACNCVCVYRGVCARERAGEHVRRGGRACVHGVCGPARSCAQVPGG